MALAAHGGLSHGHSVKEVDMSSCKPGRVLGWCILLLAGLVSASGCTGGGDKTVLVRGKVTFAGQAPPKAGKITFACETPAPGFAATPSLVDFDAAGVYEAKLLPGTYRANIECWKKPPTPSTMVTDNYVPLTYRPTVQVAVDAPGPIEASFDVPAQ
jgi:hypothetical protein